MVINNANEVRLPFIVQTVLPLIKRL